MQRKIETVIWDWNGTMLDDLSLCVASINKLLSERGIKKITHSRYQEVFGFPVKDYYERVGFDFSKEAFEVPAMQFINLYEKGMYGCSLFPEVRPTLEHFKNRGMRQLVLSAMEKPRLLETLRHNEILDFFEHVSGLEDHYAHSKLENGKRMIDELSLNPETTCIVGDTVHDFEVAEAMGIHAYLVTYGHQDEKRLLGTGGEVIRDLKELVDRIN